MTIFGLTITTVDVIIFMMVISGFYGVDRKARELGEQVDILHDRVAKLEGKLNPRNEYEDEWG